MPITPKHAFKEKSTKLLILLPLRTIYNHTFQYETPCIGNKHFFTKLLPCQAYQNYEQPCQRSQNSKFQNHFSVLNWSNLSEKKIL